MNGGKLCPSPKPDGFSLKPHCATQAIDSFPGAHQPAPECFRKRESPSRRSRTAHCTAKPCKQNSPLRGSTKQQLRAEKSPAQPFRNH